MCTVLYRTISKLLSSHQSRVLCAVEPLLDGRVGSNSFRVCDMTLTRIKVDSVSPDISILRMFLIAFIALKPRSHAVVDDDMVNISRTNNIMSANPSGVSATRLVYVSNGHRPRFLDSNIFSSGHCPMM